MSAESEEMYVRSVHFMRATLIAFAAIATAACGRDGPVSPYIPPEEEEPPITTDAVPNESVGLPLTRHRLEQPAVILDGVPRPDLLLRDIRVEDIAHLEVVEGSTEVSRDRTSPPRISVAVTTVR